MKNWGVIVRSRDINTLWSGKLCYLNAIGGWAVTTSTLCVIERDARCVQHINGLRCWTFSQLNEQSDGHGLTCCYIDRRQRCCSAASLPHILTNCRPDMWAVSCQIKIALRVQGLFHFIAGVSDACQMALHIKEFPFLLLSAYRLQRLCREWACACFNIENRCLVNWFLVLPWVRRPLMAKRFWFHFPFAICQMHLTLTKTSGETQTKRKLKNNSRCLEPFRRGVEFSSSFKK